MPAVNPSCYHLSASSIASFKACPTRFRLQYREGLRPAEDTDSQRVGTNWHAMHEQYAQALEAWKTDESESENAERSDQNEYALNAVVTLLNERYANVPSYKTPQEFALERTVLLMSFVGYLWYYQNDPIEFLASELPFELPLHLPKTGLPLPTSEVLRVGKIDHIIRWQGGVGALERKSTSRGIGADSDYWDKAKKDTQVSMYALAFKDMRIFHLQAPSTYTLRPLYDALSPDANIDSIPWFDTSERVGNTLYDVWHKPTIKPSELTQAETKAFIESGEYCGQNFAVEQILTGITVNGEPAEIKQGKKGFAIRETVDMFGARLLADIYQRPDFYFVRREIARTDIEIRQFRQQLFAVYTAQKAFEKQGMWFENEQQCRATYPCPYILICYGPGADAVCDGKTTPPGFKRIFVDLTVNGQEVEE